MDIANSKPF